MTDDIALFFELYFCCFPSFIVLSVLFISKKGSEACRIVSCDPPWMHLLIALYISQISCYISSSGKGNSAFETADHLMGVSNVLHVFGRGRVRLSWETHYVGDVRYEWVLSIY